MKKLCIYHANCLDGFGAAWAVKKALGDDVEFVEGVYGQMPPDVTNRDVIMVDFSYKMEMIDAMLNLAKSITIIDHHKTAEAEIMPALQEGLIDGIFDMTKSGAMLAWEWFHPDQEPPQLIRHIQDRDLWKFELEGTREIIAGLSSHPHDFAVWDQLMFGDTEQLRIDGNAIERKRAKDIDDFINMARTRVIIDEFNVPAVNAPPQWASDAGHILCKDEAFAVCHWHVEGAMVFSLRSDEGGADVAEIAARFGGGGHKHAAGFRIEIGEGFDTLVINSNLQLVDGDDETEESESETVH